MISHVPPPQAAQIGNFHRRLPALITHIVVVIQENRSIDNLFNGFCVSTTQCANTVSYDPYTGRMLQPFDLTHGGPGHSHEDFENEFAGGAMNGFGALADSYVPLTDTTAYQAMFSADGVLNDNILAPNMGPSFPAHLYGIAGHSGGYDPASIYAPANEDIADNPGDFTYCTSTGMVESVSLATTYPGTSTTTSVCRDHNTIFDRLPASYNWKYVSVV